MTVHSGVGRQEFFVLLDYGQGGLWAILRAGSADQVRRNYPGVEVFEGRPPMLDEATVEAIRCAGVQEVDDPPVGWLAELVEPPRSE